MSEAPQGRILITGCTGYLGGLLMHRLRSKDCPITCLTRSPQKLAFAKGEQTRVVEGDVRNDEAMARAMEGVETAYYLIHAMTDDDFEEQDRLMAYQFRAAAQKAGVKKIVYLGGLGHGEELSPHLRSRQEVGEILAGRDPACVELRAAVVIGAGSSSFETIRALTDRLPVMVCPRWVETETQPIAVDDVLAYLDQARDLPADDQIIEIGGADCVTYGDMMREYARQRGLTRFLVPVPVLTPHLSSLWLGLVTPANAQVARHLIEGLRNPTIVRHPEPARRLFDVDPVSTREAIRRALHDCIPMQKQVSRSPATEARQAAAQQS